jgi:phenylacetate-CoA ligase
MAVIEQDHRERGALDRLQRERLRRLVAEILPHNPFYNRKFTGAGLSGGDVRSLEDLTKLPFTTKQELIADQVAHPPYGHILTYPVERYCRLHQTSGTSGQPLRWLDTAGSWSRLLDCWDSFFEVVGLRSDDRLFFPFSFGPFLGFWTAFEAAARQGYFCLPGGGMSSVARLRMLLDNRASVVFCTPTYALRLAEVARQESIDLAGGPTRMIVVAGEPGGSIPATRAAIESAWGARVFDHAGMTEVGPVAIECPQNPAGLHILETEYLAEVVDPTTGDAVPPGQPGELVLTNFCRVGSPLLRYRTGDLVRVDLEPCPCGRTFMRLRGGILDRTDDMIHVRGNNFYPSALEEVIRRCSGIAEYRVAIDQSGSLPVLYIDLEPAQQAEAAAIADRVSRAVRDQFLFRAEVRTVSPGTLPRFEMKARRIIRGQGSGVRGQKT